MENKDKSKKPDLAIIAGVLEGLNYYLHNFTHSASEGAKHAYSIFKYCKDALLENANDVSRYAMPKGSHTKFVYGRFSSTTVREKILSKLR